MFTEKAAWLLKNARTNNKGCKICHLKPSDKGYCYATISRVKYSAHRLVYRHVKGPIAVGQQIRHTCDVRNCINPDHLITGTASDNMQDMHNRNRHKKGQNRKTGRQKEEMLDLYHRGFRQKEIAARFGMTQSAVSKRLKHYMKNTEIVK